MPALAAELGTTRSAAALELWRDRLDGAVVAIGNAPTALFRLLEMVEQGAPRPAAVIGVPVGFIGAAESKDALAAHPSGLEHLIVRGRRGGSAIAAAALNAIASEDEVSTTSRRPSKARSTADEGTELVASREARRAGRLYGVGLGPGDPRTDDRARGAGHRARPTSSRTTARGTGGRSPGRSRPATCAPTTSRNRWSTR